VAKLLSQKLAADCGSTGATNPDISERNVINYCDLSRGVSNSSPPKKGQSFTWITVRL
jgi:hypothetical protein